MTRTSNRVSRIHLLYPIELRIQYIIEYISGIEKQYLFSIVFNKTRPIVFLLLPRKAQKSIGRNLKNRLLPVAVSYRLTREKKYDLG